MKSQYELSVVLLIINIFLLNICLFIFTSIFVLSYRKVQLLACTAIFKIDNQQGSTVQHRELCPAFCNNLNGKRILKSLDICICLTEPICCTPETNMTLQINYTLIWRRKWQPTPVFLPRETHGQRSLAGYSPWTRKESDMTQ